MRPWWTVAWLLMLLGGFGLMFFSYRRYHRVERPTRWNQAVMCVAEDVPPEEPGRLGGWPAVAWFLPLRLESETICRALFKGRPDFGRSFLRNHQEKVILFPDFREAFEEEMLASGRLPSPGHREVVAGHETVHRGQVTVADQAFRVVGVFRREQWPFSRAYLLPDHAAHRTLFDLAREPVKRVYVFTRAEWKDLGDQGKDLFPKDRFTRVAGALRAERGAYYAYLLGMALVLFGGSALLISGFVYWSRRAQGRWIGQPLAEIRRRKGLFCSLHLIYFGLCLVCMLLIYEFPDVQDALVMVLRGEIEEGSGPLAVAGRAYGSGNIALAAIVTLAINFILGSFAVITLPSVVLPGIGVLVALWRALLWGLLLAPMSLWASRAMVAHSGTLLLEGEAYILASFFALLIPLYLFDRQAGPTVGSRYGRALLINLKGNLLVLVVLAVAASYEAVEVILQMPG